jgi:ribosomal protein S27E
MKQYREVKTETRLPETGRHLTSTGWKDYDAENDTWHEKDPYNPMYVIETIAPLYWLEPITPTESAEGLRKEINEMYKTDIDVLMSLTATPAPLIEYIKRLESRLLSQPTQNKVESNTGGYSKDDLSNMLEDVVNELELSGDAIEKHGPLGTAPAELVRLVLDEKDLKIRALQNGMTDLSHTPPQPTEQISDEEIVQEVKQYFNKYFKQQYFKESDKEYKSLIRLLKKRPIPKPTEPSMRAEEFVNRLLSIYDEYKTELRKAATMEEVAEVEYNFTVSKENIIDSLSQPQSKEIIRCPECGNFRKNLLAYNNAKDKIKCIHCAHEWSVQPQSKEEEKESAKEGEFTDIKVKLLKEAKHRLNMVCYDPDLIPKLDKVWDLINYLDTEHEETEVCHFNYIDDNNMICKHTGVHCDIVKQDTVTGSSCWSCDHNPKNK